jgi:4-hydroxy-3-methylbut-2-enyl diphosphate reductase
VVIVPAFGTDVKTLAEIKARGCQIVDTTCGDVMSVWKRVRQNAADDMTSIIHGKASHEETKATASRAMKDGKGHYLVVLTLADTDYVCDYIHRGGTKRRFWNTSAAATATVLILTCTSAASAWRTRRR